MSLRRIAGYVGTSFIAIGGCSFAPHYSRPATQPPPPAYRENSGWKQARPADARDRGPWWHAFQDAGLDSLEDKVTSANQDIKAAYARLQEARAQTRIARAAYFPTLTAGPKATRARASVNSPLYSGTKPATGNDFELDADVSYEFDVWGRVRNSVASARAEAQASAEDLASLDLSTHAELASDYFTLRGLDTQQQLLDATVADYVKALDQTQTLYDGGAVALPDLQQSQLQLESARTQATDIHLRRAQTEHAIAVLIGESASTFHLEAQPLALEVAPPPIDPGLPSQLLERRPDVAAAERRVAAANAQIGVARAAYFPVFSLSAQAGFESTVTSNLIGAPSRFWSVGPSALLTVFDAGRHRAQSAQAHAMYDAQVATYRGAVLTAYQEVEDNLAALRDLETESVSEAAAVAASAGALNQSQYQYKGGIATYLQVVVIENESLSARLAAADIQVRRMAATVLLFKALGGGWGGNASSGS